MKDKTDIATEVGSNLSSKDKAERSSYDITEPQINACSPTDCTGIVPIPPQSDEELDSYLDVYQFQPVITQNKN